ncbi:MAG: hypothetical protein WBX25_09800 [Rhodomicrobium sp.]
MTKRFLVLLILPLVHAFFGLGACTARAAPSPPAFTIAPASRPGHVLAGYDGCGWDYHCPPRPDYRHRFRHRNGQTYIRSNYGTVNVYVNGGRRETGPNRAEWDCCEPGPRVPGAEAEDGGYDRSCGGYPCREDCGPFCWMHRFRKGYCGHGCEAYRKRVHFERAERVVEYPRPIYYRDPSPAPRSYRPPEPDLPETRYRSEEPYPPIRRDSAPRERFEGPKYPADCSYGGC